MGLVVYFSRLFLERARQGRPGGETLHAGFVRAMCACVCWCGSMRPASLMANFKDPKSRSRPMGFFFSRALASLDSRGKVAAGTTYAFFTLLPLIRPRVLFFSSPHSNSYISSTQWNSPFPCLCTCVRACAHLYVGNNSDHNSRKIIERLALLFGLEGSEREGKVDLWVFKPLQWVVWKARRLCDYKVFKTIQNYMPIQLMTFERGLWLPKLCLLIRVNKLIFIHFQRLIAWSFLSLQSTNIMSTSAPSHNFLKIAAPGVELNQFAIRFVLIRLKTHKLTFIALEYSRMYIRESAQYGSYIRGVANTQHQHFLRQRTVGSSFSRWYVYGSGFCLLPRFSFQKTWVDELVPMRI